MTHALRLLVRTAGELALTAGVLVLLFVGWALWWTGRATTAEAADAAEGLQDRWTAAAPAATTPRPAEVAASAPPGGTAFAVLHVPRFGAGWRMPIVQGTGAGVLRKGVGHYSGTVMPGAVGNLGLAGHRTTWSHPFRDVERLRTGDTVTVETAAGWFDYRVTGHRVVGPGDREVLRAVPGQRLLTMTTCHPKYSARKRWVVTAVLAGSRART